MIEQHVKLSEVQNAIQIPRLGRPGHVSLLVLLFVLLTARTISTSLQQGRWEPGQVLGNFFLAQCLSRHHHCDSYLREGQTFRWHKGQRWGACPASLAWWQVGLQPLPLLTFGDWGRAKRAMGQAGRQASGCALFSWAGPLGCRAGWGNWWVRRLPCPCLATSPLACWTTPTLKPARLSSHSPDHR